MPSAGHNDIEEDVVLVDDAVERKVVPVDPVPLPDYPEENNYISDYTTDYQEYTDYNTVEEDSDSEEYSEYNTVEEDSEYNAVADYDYTDHASDVAVTGGDVDGDVGGGGAGGGGGVVCPGGDLYTCIDVCPGQFGARVFGLCVATCGRRCP